MRIAVPLALGLGVVTGIASAATRQQIGSWVLSCADPEGCTMRSGKRFLDSGGVTGDLEVQALGRSLVPVVTLRGLSREMLLAASMAGKTEVTLQFPGGPREALVCSADTAGYVCSPRGEAARSLAVSLPAAASVTVRLAASVTGLRPLPVQEKTLDLSGTRQALARLRSVGPAPVAISLTAMVSQTPGELIEKADKVLKAAGYPGVTELLAKYRAVK